MIFPTLATLLICVSLSAASADEKELYNKLFDNDSYVAHVRPRLNSSQPVIIKVDFEVNQIKELNERSQTLHTVGFVQSEWIDDYLKWNPDDYSGVQELIVPPNMIWLPDFGITNSAEKFYEEDFFEFFRVHIKFTGRVIWAFGGVFITSCELDTLLFPFDRQRCYFMIENWAYTNQSVALINGSDKIRLDNYHENGIWKLIHSEAKVNGITIGLDPDEVYSQVQYTIHLQRKPRYYLVNIVIPCVFLTSIALLVFWLPPEAGEKVSLGVTVLLAFSVFQLIIAGSTPENSDSTPILSAFVTLTMALATISVVTTVLVLQLHHRDPSQRLPKWLHAVAIDFLPRLLCMWTLARRTPKRDDTEENVRYNPHEDLRQDKIEEVERVEDSAQLAPAVFRSLGKQVEKVTSELRVLTGRLHEKEQEKVALEEWQAVAKVLDRLLFWIVLIVLVSAIIWLMAMSSKT